MEWINDTYNAFKGKNVFFRHHVFSFSPWVVSSVKKCIGGVSNPGNTLPLPSLKLEGGFKMLGKNRALLLSRLKGNTLKLYFIAKELVTSRTKKIHQGDASA